MNTTQKNSQNIVIIYYDDTDDTPLYYVLGDNVRLFCVDDNAPDDRIYEWVDRDTKEEIKEIIPDGSFVSNKNGETYPFHLNDILK